MYKTHDFSPYGSIEPSLCKSSLVRSSTVSRMLKENPDTPYFEFTGTLREDGRTQPLRDFPRCLSEIDNFECRN
jgi:hypothetical protein